MINWRGQKMNKLEKAERLALHYAEQIAELENKIADIKANCDLAIEGRDVKIKELEKENAELKKKCYKKAVKDYCELKKENAELKKKIGIYQKGMYDEIEKRDKKLTKAKEIIKELLLLPYANNEEVFADVTSTLNKAEQFLKEIEK